MQDLDRLERIGLQVKQTSLCGLGQTAPNPVLSTLKHFREEYEATFSGNAVPRECVKRWCFHRASMHAPQGSMFPRTSRLSARENTRRPWT